MNEVLGGFRVLKSPTFVVDEFCYGFIGSSGDFSNSHLKESSKELAQLLGVKKLVLPEQIHGSGISSIPSPNGPAEEGGLIWYPEVDGLLVHKLDPHCVYGIRTADCLPVLMRLQDRLLILHAGWRGLAADIIANGISLISRAVAGGTLRCLIGPAASVEQYQVGEEVIADIHRGTGVEPRFLTKDGEFWLDLAKTAERLISSASAGVGLTAEIDTINECTIGSREWHSYRRDGSSRGSNLMFVVGRG